MTTTTATTGPVAAPPTITSPRTRAVATTSAILAALGGTTVLPWLVNGYVISLASNAIILALLATSVHLLATAGLISFGQTAYLAVGAYTAAQLLRSGITSAPTILLTAAGTAALTAAATSLVVLRSRGQVYLMVTFAVGQLAVLAAAKLPGLGGDEGLPVTTATHLPGIGPLTGDGPIYLYGLATMVVTTAAVAGILQTRLGLVLRAVADHEPRTAALGYRVTAHLLVVSTFAGAVAGTAGALLTTAHRSVAPADCGFDAAALALLAATIGAGRLGGTILGAVLIVATRDLVGAATGGHGTALLGVLFLAVAYGRPYLSRLRGTARKHP